jgi:oligosaccharide reducing-end xylanase
MWILSSLPRTSSAGTVSAPYEIGTWSGFRPGAISYTFDDDTTNQYAVAVPMFNAKGFRMTLFTVTDWVPGGSWEQVQKAAAAGHEIASHTVTHPRLSELTAAQQTNELADSQAKINANVRDQKCVTLAYPYCVPGTEAITRTYYIAARGCSGQLVPRTPADFMNISSFVCGPQGAVKTAQDFNQLADRAAAANEWCVYLIHAIDNENGYSPLSSSILKSHLNFVGAHPDKFWVETFGNVVRYIRERDDASVTELSHDASRITLHVTGTLDSSIYNVPISVRRPLPEGWSTVMVSRNNVPVKARVFSLNSTHYVMFDVVPNGGDITLWKNPPMIALDSAALAATPTVSIQLDGVPGHVYGVYASSNLVDWTLVATNLLVGKSTNIDLPISSGTLYYRTKWMN